LQGAFAAGDDAAFADRKGHLKRRLIQVIADQTGKIFDPNKIILVWARRFAEYKRADLIRRDIARFNTLIQSTKHPVQIVWAGKPYPGDTGAISVFNHLVKISKKEPNLAVLTGYELTLSGLLKTGSDVWLNTPRRPREASGTSGMTAAMNGSVNLSISDGWIPEFAKHGENAFILPIVDLSLNQDEQDNLDAANLLTMLESEVLPLYYDTPEKWHTLVKNSMRDVTPYFDSDRMADEYYKLYTGIEFTPEPPIVVDYAIPAL
jgi:starch phosphorylase